MGGLQLENARSKIVSGTTGQNLKLRHDNCLSSGTIFQVRFLIAALLTFVFSVDASAQARVDLEDMSVKGELLNDNRMRMSSREATRVQDRVKYRKNFRPEIIDGIDVRLPAAESLEEVESK